MRPLALDNPETAAAAAAAVAAAAEAGPAMGNGTSDEAGTSGASGSRGRCAQLQLVAPLISCGTLPAAGAVHWLWPPLLGLLWHPSPLPCRTLTVPA